MNVPGLIKNANAQKFWLKPEGGEFTKIEELDGSILAGTPDDIVRGIQRYQEIGCDLLIFDFRMRFPDWLEQIETLAREVLPRVVRPRAGAQGRLAVKTTTTTQVTHYEIQKKRRESLLDEWKGYHKTVIKRSDVVMHDVPGRRMRSGVYAGFDGDRPTKNLDATLHEIAPHTTTTIHRHSWDAIEFIESGSAGPRSTASASTGGRGTRSTCPAGRGTGTAMTATSRRCSTPGASSRCSSSSASRSSRRAATRPSPSSRRDRSRSPARGQRSARPPDPAPRPAVGGHRERAPHHALR